MAKLELSVDDLRDARWLLLNATPASCAALALVSDVAARVAAHEANAKTRKQKRRKANMDKLQVAVGAIVGGMLRRWARREPEAVFRSRTPRDFTGSPVGARQFLAVVDAMATLDLVRRSTSIRYAFFDFGDGTSAFRGKAPRYWPSPGLLGLAAHHGVTPATIRADFTDLVPTVPPAVPKAVQVFALKQRGQSDRFALPFTNLGVEASHIRQRVEDANAFAAEHEIRGCLPPRWYRVFVECSLLGGRWQAAGKEGVYQMMPEADRVANITINGEPVCEVDVKASHLSIMHGLLGLPLPEGDPYAIPDVPRAVVKAWITATLGKGTPVRRWATRAVKDAPALEGYDPRETGAVICARYPFLRSPARAVAAAARLDRLEHIGSPERILTHRLMAIEADAITGAMDVLWGRGVLALPIHDSLIVPHSAARYVGGALDSSFEYFAKVRVRWTVEGAGQHAGHMPL
jgi:hypothetical protein